MRANSNLVQRVARYKDEVNQDLSDAMALGIGGTPSS
jgi:hypothetical protein